MNVNEGSTIVVHRNTAQTPLVPTRVLVEPVTQEACQAALVRKSLQSNSKISYLPISINQFTVFLMKLCVFFFLDIDECKTGKDNCNKTYTFCKNTVGSFLCMCKTGFESFGNGCRGKYDPHFEN